MKKLINFCILILVSKLDFLNLQTGFWILQIYKKNIYNKPLALLAAPNQ